MEKTAGTTELEREGAVYETAAGVVEKTAFMPDYGFRQPETSSGRAPGEEAETSGAGETAGTAVAGITGSIITVILAGGLGFIIYAARRKKMNTRAA
jgi:cobalt/nickel transport system permease protein